MTRETILGAMQPIDLSEMKGIKLMNRIDTKFLATEEALMRMLEMAQSGYRVQEIEGRRIASYDTIYYDTAGVDMYLAHHNQKLCRQKIRTRRYVDSGTAFLEIKNKNNRGETKKVRTPIAADDFHDFKGNLSAIEFIGNGSSYPHRLISPHLRTGFQRITLVNRRETERLTMDMGVAFENIRTGEKKTLPGLVIIEVKQEGLCHSEMKDILLQLRIQPSKFSKYCIGTVWTNPAVKSNRFKEAIHDIHKLTTRYQ